MFAESSPRGERSRDEEVLKRSGRRTAIAVLRQLALVLLVAGATAVLAGAATQTHVAAQDDSEGEELYQAKCANCHQPDGRGVPGAFPPLAGNPKVEDTDYVLTVIQDGLAGPIVVNGQPFDVVMPAVTGMSEAEQQSVTEYVSTLANVTLGPPPEEGEVEEPNAATGEKLFRGSKGFANGAPSCAACHTAGSIGNLGGYSLGPDLTDSHAKFGGSPGLSAWLRVPSSQTMLPVFADGPLTGSELGHLSAFLETAPDQDRESGIDLMLIAGLVGAAVLFAAMALAWRDMRTPYAQQLRSRR